MRVTDEIIYIGVNDHNVDLFEGQYRVPNGISYNSYIIMDDKIAIMDTVDIGFVDEWLANVKTALGSRKPDYLVVQHMEPDHSASIKKFLEAYPDTTIVGNAKTFVMMVNFFRNVSFDNRLEVKNKDTIELGHHVLTFVFAPMVHWPEVMVTYDSADKVLFSADGFGKFGALDTDGVWDDEARRYYIGIVGKYGAQVHMLLNAAATLDIKMICPLHGPVLRDNLAHYISLYDTWSSYRPQKDGVVIAYASIYGNTKEAVQLLADRLKEKGTEVEIYDLARDDMAEAVSAAFEYSKLVLASPTYNGDVFPCMRFFIEHLTERNYQKRTVAYIENGSWAPMAAKVMAGMLEKSKELNVIEDIVKITSSVSEENISELDALAQKLAALQP